MSTSNSKLDILILSALACDPQRLNESQNNDETKPSSTSSLSSNSSTNSLNSEENSTSSSSFTTAPSTSLTPVGSIIPTSTFTVSSSSSSSLLKEEDNKKEFSKNFLNPEIKTPGPPDVLPADRRAIRDKIRLSLQRRAPTYEHLSELFTILIEEQAFENAPSKLDYYKAGINTCKKIYDRCLERTNNNSIDTSKLSTSNSSSNINERREDNGINNTNLSTTSLSSTSNGDNDNEINNNSNNNNNNNNEENEEIPPRLIKRFKTEH